MIQRVFLLSLNVTFFLFSGCSSSPGTGDSWQSLGGPYARDVATVMADPSRPGIVYAALTTGEILRSANNGTTWDPLASFGRGVLPYRFLASVDTPVVFLGATDAGLFVASANRRQWKKLLLGDLPPNTGAHTVAIDPWKPSTWYAGTDGHGIYKSTDAGTTWSASNGTSTDLSVSTVVDLAIDVSRPNRVVAAVNGLGLVESPDGGTQWTRLTEEFTPTGSQIVRVLLDKNIVVYATGSGSVQRSIDDGRSWSPTRIARETGRIFSFERSPNQPEVLLAGTSEGPLVSTDFGLTWSDVSGSLPHVSCSTAFGSEKRTGVYYAYGEAIGLQRTTDNGFNWESADQALGGSTIRLLATDEQGDRVYTVLTRSILNYDMSSGQWAPAGIGLEGDTVQALSVSTESSLSAISSTTLGVFKTTDGGRLWSPLSTRLPLIPRVLDIQPRVKMRVLASGDQGLFISTDAGETWVHSLPVADRYDVRSFTFMPTDASVVYAATGNTASVISHDGGITWEPSRYGISSRSINVITLDDQDPSIAYAWTPEGESFRSTNAGLEWNRYAPPWNPGDSVVLAVDRFMPSSAVAMVKNRQLYYTRDGGGIWSPLPGQDIHGEVTALLWNQKSEVLFAAVRHRGLFMLSLRPVITRILGG